MRSAEQLLLVATDELRLLDVATELLGEQYGYGARYVVLHDDATNELYLGGAAGALADTVAVRSYRRPDAAGLSGSCWSTGQIVNVADVHADPRYMEVLPTCRSEICVPIVAGDKVLGVLGIQAEQLAAFTEDDERLLSAFRSPFAIEGNTILARLSIGAALAPQGGRRRRELLRNVDGALYSAKAAGRDCYVVFNPN